MGRQIGHEVTPETREKIAAALRGRKPVWTGQPKTKAHREALSMSAKQRDPTTRLRGPHHPDWRGGEAGYMAVHNWVRRHKGRAALQTCACGERADEWANISGSYFRDLDDYRAMCVPCHRRFDSRRRTANKG